MKSLLVLLLLGLIAPHCYAQPSYDSLKQEVLQLKQSIDNIDYNMQAHHRQFKTGTAFVGIGLLLSITGTLLQGGTKNTDYTGNILTTAGAVGTLTGSIIMIDAHRWLGRGALRRKR